MFKQKGHGSESMKAAGSGNACKIWWPLSSVWDIRMKDGNNQGWNFAGGLGLISSRFTAEGPLKKDKSSMIISA